METAIALFVCRIGFSLAGLVIAVYAVYLATRRIDLPNRLHDELANLRAKMKTLETSVEQMVGAYEDRLTRAQKAMAGQSGGRPRRVQEVAPEPRAEAPQGGNGPHLLMPPGNGAVRAAIRNARQNRERAG